MSLQLTITQPATEDIKQIADYLAEQSGLTRADRFLAELDGKLIKIAKFPNIGRKRSSILPNARSLSVGNYLILYLRTDTDIAILRVVSGYRDLQALFDD